MPRYNSTIAKQFPAESGLLLFVGSLLVHILYKFSHANASKFHICAYVWYENQSGEEANKKVRTE